MIPIHIGIILDGNRRFAKQLLKRPWEGHKMGMLKAREVLKWSCEKGIKFITAYALSLENLSSRPKKELSYILEQMENECDSMLSDSNHVIHKHKVRVRFIGRTHMLPYRLQQKMSLVAKKTENYKNHALNIAVAYGGQQEIVDAVKKILEKGLKGIIKPSDLNEDIIKEHLYTNGQPPLDLVVRTGGDQRLSNFLLYQSAYSELMFTQIKWPEIQQKDFDAMIKDFEKRQRKFGR